MLLVSIHLASSLVKASGARPQECAAASIDGQARTDRKVAPLRPVFSNARMIKLDIVSEEDCTPANTSTGFPGWAPPMKTMVMDIQCELDSCAVVTRRRGACILLPCVQRPNFSACRLDGALALVAFFEREGLQQLRRWRRWRRLLPLLLLRP